MLHTALPKLNLKFGLIRGRQAKRDPIPRVIVAGNVGIHVIKRVAGVNCQEPIDIVSKGNAHQIQVLVGLVIETTIVLRPLPLPIEAGVEIGQQLMVDPAVE